MLIVATISAAFAATAIAFRARTPRRRHSNRAALVAARPATSAVAVVVALAAMVLVVPGSARAAIVPTVGLATAASYSVLAGTTIENTGPSLLDQNAGVAPGAAIVGFPPGQSLGILDPATATAAQAQADLTIAYIDAANRPVDATTSGELGGLTLVGGVYNGPSNSPLQITGPLVLDGQGDPNSVFIFQTGSTLTTASASTVTLINGAQECNVFWQVGSSATLGTGSVFTGNILALTSISVNTGVTVHGRALARNAAVTLDDDVFTSPTCDLTSSTTTTTTATTTATTATTAPATVATTLPGSGTTVVDTATTLAAVPPIAPVVSTTFATPATAPSRRLPSTGLATTTQLGLAVALMATGLVAVRLARRWPVVV